MLARIPMLDPVYFAPSDRAEAAGEAVDRNSLAYARRYQFIDHAVSQLREDLAESGLDESDEIYASSQKLVSFLVDGVGELEDFLLSAASLVFEKHIYASGFDSQQYGQMHALIDHTLNKLDSEGDNAISKFTETLMNYEFTAAVFMIANFMIDEYNKEVDRGTMNAMVFAAPTTLQ